MTRDYRDTVFLPATDFPMRAGLRDKEPEILKLWEDLDLYKTLRAQSQGRDKFILHDGPPYANGDIHIGHALNKILKDMIVRSQQMLGKDAPYVPGWDCHGLPIEWKVEEAYRAAGKDKDQVSVVDFRRECREFAEKWIQIQIPQFKRLGVLGNWDDPYKTMTYAAEAQIVRELGTFLQSGQLYRGEKPVLWSIPERTALADAEVEYGPHKSVTIWVRFPVVTAQNPALRDASLVIWTTTTWTIPGNRALACHRDLTYGLYQVDALGEGSQARPGERLVIADDLATEVQAAAKIATWTRLGEAGPLAGTVCAHPLRALGFDHDVPVFHGDFVTADAGTGLVHMAPGHGVEDFELAHLHHGLEVPQTVAGDGTFYPHVPVFAGLSVYDADGKDGTALGAILRALSEQGGLLAKGKIEHDYPHSWRSKAPLIYRNTAQWFISMEDEQGDQGLRAKALKAIDDTDFYPPQGQNRLRSMIETRPDWCVSRQRLWGVPLPIFIEKATGQPLRDPAVVARIADAFDLEGGDAWFDSPGERFLGPNYDPEDYEQSRDVVEVWFDSGSTHAFVLEARGQELAWPADLYLEGSDQHRGWFHSSLLESCGTRDRAPYKGVLTHGMTMDGAGKKMSKSIGNTVSPLEVADKFGIDILRLWVCTTDYRGDQRLSDAILKKTADIYRRFRNTFRYLLGALVDFTPTGQWSPLDLPELERYICHRLKETEDAVDAAMRAYDFHEAFQQLLKFVSQDLSALFFDVRKDRLYCDGLDVPGRQLTLEVMACVLDSLTTRLAPILVFTVDEVWQARPPGLRRASDPASVHLRDFHRTSPECLHPEFAAKWAKILEVRKAVLTALERAREEKRIGSALEAQVEITARADMRMACAAVDLAELCIISAAIMRPGRSLTVSVMPAQGEKCPRCWNIREDLHVTGVCYRCADVLEGA